MPRGPTTLESLPSASPAPPPNASLHARVRSRRAAPSPATYLCNASKRFARSLELNDTFQSMADLCVPHLGHACIVYLFGERLTPGEVTTSKHIDPARQDLLQALAQRAFSDTAGRQPLLEVAWTRRAAVLSQLKTAELIGDGRPAHILQSDLHLKTAALLPVANGEHVLGITICLTDSTRCYTPTQVRLAQDLSDRFALALTAAQMYAACKAALDANQEMLASAIHDLMSPLTYIKGSAQRLRRVNWSDIDLATTTEFEKRLNAIDAAVTRMAAALAALMETTRPRPPALGRAPRAQTTDLVPIVSEIADLEQLLAPDHTIRLAHDLAEPVIGTWDADQVRRMLANLIGNAVKYSPAGACVEIQLKSVVDDEGRWAMLSVTDQGIGIPAGDLPFVFEPFHRGSNVGPVNGTGLGLASVWQIVRTQQGRLWVDSEEGKGTRVTVRLPLPRT